MLYQHHLQRLLSCVTHSVVKVAHGYNPNTTGPQNLILPDASPVQLAGVHNLMLNVHPYFRVSTHETQGSPYHVEITGYRYVIHDSEHREILAYHWHPGPREAVRTPHLHLGAGAGLSFKALETKPHLPTRHITLGEIIRFLIDDLSVQPIRNDWKDVLNEVVEPVPAP